MNKGDINFNINILISIFLWHANTHLMLSLEWIYIYIFPLINILEGILNINVMVEPYETAIFVGPCIHAKVYMTEQVLILS